MRYLFALSSLCAAVVVASPLQKRGIYAAPAVAAAPEPYVEIVTNVVMVTITAPPVIVTEGVTPVTPVTPEPPVTPVTPETPVEPTPVALALAQAYTPSPPETTTTTSKAPVSTSSEAPRPTDAFIANAIDTHNAARAKHGVAPMVWNATLADIASQEGSCAKFEHIMSIDGGNYGQNIAVAGSSSADAYDNPTALKNAINQWYDEVNLFSGLYNVPSPSEAVGDFLHFTQMVWADSKTVACAIQNCGTDNGIYPGMFVWYTVCNYYPPGNVLGEFAKNVLSS